MIDTLHQGGLDVIVFIQQMRTSFLDYFFLAVTSLGSDYFYMLILPFFYWCVDKSFSLRLFYLFMFSNWLNAIAKNLFNLPRPFMIDKSVQVAHASGPGIPSGHAQGSLVFWGFLALWVKKRWFTIFCLCLIFSIAFSRLYLGVHFPTDIIGGWFLGLLLLLLGHMLFDKIEKRIASLPTMYVVIMGTIIPIVLSFILPTKYSVSPMGITAGISLAAILEKKYINFEMPTTIKEGIWRYAMGIAVLFIIYLPLKVIIRQENPFYLPFVFLQYYVMGLWVAWIAPWFFVKTKFLAKKQSIEFTRIDTKTK